MRLFAFISPACLICFALMSGCSTSQLVARGASPLIEHGLAAMNHETDYELARLGIPANLKMIEGLLLADPGNTAYRVQAAMGFYGYAAGFVEDDDPARASALYRRAFEHARQALVAEGVTTAQLDAAMPEFETTLNDLPAKAVPALFWTASAWGKWIENQLDDPARLAELPRVEVMMQRVLTLDDTYYFGGAHLFFGAYLGGRAPMFGGDFVRAAQHFDQAARINRNQLLLVEVYRSQYLLRQMGDRAAFHDALSKVIEAAESSSPEMNLANAIAKKKASKLLADEDTLF